MLKAILFDMDGVLIDAKEWHYKALNRALGLFGYEITREMHISQYDGLPTRVKLNMLTEEFGLPASLHSFISEMKQQYTMSIIWQECRPRFNHEYALSRLKRDGFKLGLGSNSIRATVETMMNKSHLSSYFDVMLSNEDVSKPKPSPEIYTKLMEALNIEPHECLICEDNEHGIAAAKASGAYLLKIGTVDDVTYENIQSRIDEIHKDNQL